MLEQVRGKHTGIVIADALHGNHGDFYPQAVFHGLQQAVDAPDILRMNDPVRITHMIIPVRETDIRDRLDRIVLCCSKLLREKGEEKQACKQQCLQTFACQCFIQISHSLSELIGLKFHFRSFLCTAFRTEISFRLESEHTGKDIGRETADIGIVGLRCFIETLAFHGNTVLRTFQLSL